MDKIKVIFTGGTIGSLADGNDIQTNADAKFLLMEKYREVYGKDLNRFVTSAPLSILSENANVKNVFEMAEAINIAQNDKCKGIIMTHGTDTLAYSAAYLSLLVNCKVPVVLVSANYILTDKRSNGLYNLAAAVELIDHPNVKPNVYVAYKNTEDDYTSIHLGCRMVEPHAHSESFYSPEGFRYAHFKKGKMIFENTNVQKTSKKFVFKGNLTKKPLYIKPFNGLDYNVFDIERCDYILHDLYHSGTANTCDYYDHTYQTNFLNFADLCKSKKIPLYLCNIDKKDVNYNSTNKMKEKDVEILYNVLPNVALAKLCIAFNLIDKKQRKDYLDTNICGELLSTESLEDTDKDANALK